MDSQDFEEFPAKAVEPLQVQESESSLRSSQVALENLGQHLKLELGLGGGAAVTSGPGVASGSSLGLELGGRATMASSLGTGLNISPEVCHVADMGPANGSAAPRLDPESQRRLSLQEPQTSLDSTRTPQRHSSDPGGS